MGFSKGAATWLVGSPTAEALLSPALGPCEFEDEDPNEGGE